ncbi:MAG TPA: flagellar biosynthetic protein FliR, partial [Acidimicrobiales bacterium]|nr:flagellar biosynthetic protein FliR [Acidimicrobiales bacterium]
MQLSVDPHWLMAFALASIRALAWLVVVPPFSNRRVIPTVASIGIATGLGVLAAPQLLHGTLPNDTAGLVGAVVLQIVIGVALGLAVQFLVSSVMAAGALVDMFGGINPPPSIDPLSENQVPIMGQFTEQVAIVLLFVTNGEMLLIHGFVASFGSHGLTLSSMGSVANMLTS